MAAAQTRDRFVAPDASRDSDGDGLSDFDEIHKYLTDPAKKDSDGDGTPDGDWNERRRVRVFRADGPALSAAVR